jgi:putative endonuclease
VRQFYMYILASSSRVLYVGVTNDLRRRIHEHRTAASGFTADYHVHHLVYFEATGNPLDGSRAGLVELEHHRTVWHSRSFGRYAPSG